MYKMHYCSKEFSKNRQALGGSLPPSPLTFDFGALKLRDLAECFFFELIMTKLNF